MAGGPSRMHCRTACTQYGLPACTVRGVPSWVPGHGYTTVGTPLTLGLPSSGHRVPDWPPAFAFDQSYTNYILVIWKPKLVRRCLLIRYD